MTIFKKMSSILTFVLCFFSLTTIQAQADSTVGPRKDQVGPQKDEKLESSLLWKITGNGIKPSYLFGTIHMIAEKDFFWTKPMEQAFKKSKKLVMEMDMSQQMAMAVQMMQLAPMQGGKTLKDLLSEEEYALVENYFNTEAKSPQAKMTFGIAQNWQPMLLQSLLYTEMIDGPVKMYEMELTEKARKAEMAFGGLESVADQMSAFNSIPYPAQAQALVEMVKNMKEGKSGENEFAKMVVFYKAQDVEGMLNAMQGELDEMNSQEDLLDNRNKKWIPQIGEISKKMSTFYAVGAGHLGGKNGVIRLLRAEGYKVTAVK